jgi:hypothetical protein
VDTVVVTCSFCGKGTTEVSRLIQGPGVAICDGCTRVCYQIIEDVDGAVHVPPSAPDEVMAAVTQAQQLALLGNRDQARQAFAAIWEQIGPEGDALQRMTLAHYMADLQDDPGVELEWDLRALAAAESLTDERATSYHSTLLVRGFYASLHLNLANDYQKLDRVQDARRHLTLAENATPDLPPDGYGDLVRSGIATLRQQLAPSG